MNEGLHPLSAGGKWKSLVILFLVGMVFVNALILWYGRSFGIEGYADFSAFYTAGKLLERGQGSHLYDLDAQWAVQQEFASKVTIRHKALPYIRPPFEAILFLPFALFPYKTAFILWTVVNIGLLFIFPFLLQSSGFPVESRWLQGLLCFSYVPVAIDLLHGQDTIILLLILTLALLCMKRCADLRAGLWLALGLVKFHLILPIVLILALRRKWKVVAGFVAGGIALGCFSVAIVGWQGMMAYPSYLSSLNMNPNAGMVSAETMPNFRGALSIFWGDKIPAYGNWLLAAILSIGIVFVVSIWKRNAGSCKILEIGLSMAIITTILSSYYARSFDMVLFLIPFFLLTDVFVRTPQLDGWPKKSYLLAAGVLCSPLLWFPFLGYGRFYAAIPFMVLLLLAGARAIKVFQSAGTTVRVF